jgi:hypothetical protein
MKADDANVMTGTLDKDYNHIWYVQAWLSNVVRPDTYIHDATQAGDNELADSFRRAQANSRKGTELGKGLLRSRLARRAPRTSIYIRGNEDGKTTSAHERIALFCRAACVVVLRAAVDRALPARASRCVRRLTWSHRSRDPNPRG